MACPIHNCTLNQNRWHPSYTPDIDYFQFLIVGSHKVTCVFLQKQSRKLFKGKPLWILHAPLFSWRFLEFTTTNLAREEIKNRRCFKPESWVLKKEGQMNHIPEISISSDRCLWEYLEIRQYISSFHGRS